VPNQHLEPDNSDNSNSGAGTVIGSGLGYLDQTGSGKGQVGTGEGFLHAYGHGMGGVYKPVNAKDNGSGNLYFWGNGAGLGSENG